MNKALYISSLVLSLLFGVVIIYYINWVNSSRYSLWDAGEFNGISTAGERTTEGAWVSLLFFSFFSMTFLLGLIKIKRVTNKVLSIVGLSLTTLFLLWDLAMLSASENLSFDEVGVGFFFFVPVITAFSIVGIVQSTRYKRQGASTKQMKESDLLDS